MMRLAVRVFAIAALCVAQLGLANALSFSSTDGDFTAAFPEEPKFEKSSAKTAGGIPYDQYLWSVDKGESWYGVGMIAYSKPVKDEYDGPTNGAVAATKGKLVSQQPFQLQGMTGREIFIESPGPLIIRQRLLWVSGKLYQFLFVGPPGSEKSEDADAFLNSVHIGK